MKGKNIKKIYVLILLLYVLLTACAQPGVDVTPEQSQEAPDRSAHNWMTEPWQHSSAAYAGGTYYVEKYISGLEYQLDREYYDSSSEYRCWGSDFYALTEYRMSADSSGPELYYLSCYSDATEKIRHQQIRLPDLEEYEDAEFIVSSYDILNPQEVALFVQVLRESETLAFLAMHFSCEGEFLKTVDLYPALQMNGCVLEDKLIIPFICTDREGRFFFITFSGEMKVVVLDVDGKPLSELKWDEEDTFSLFAMKTAEGEPVFEQYSGRGQEMRLVMYDPATGGERVFNEQLPSGSPKIITGDGILYYGDRGQLYRWDLYSGDIGVCFHYDEIGLGRNNSMTCIGVSGTGFPVIMDTSREKAVICKLGREQGESGEPIRLVSLVKDSSFIASSATMFSQEYMEHPILVQQPEGSLADFRTRAMADLTAGRGADIYYVSGEDMRTLYEKGILADLNGILGEELREAVYEGALACGMIDGHQTGLPPEAYVTTLLVSDKLWRGESWTLEEALTVMDGHPELKRIMVSRRFMTRPTALRLLLLQDLQNSPFLDMDAGICDFNNDLFIKALETVGEATGGSAFPSVVKNGEAASFHPNMESFVDFSDEMSHIGEGFHFVGFPTEAECGSYWNADYFLVVNEKAEHRELIDAYLATLFSWYRQRELSHPVRRDTVDKNIYYMEDDPIGSPWNYTIGGGVYYRLATKPDGQPWTEEYKDLLDRAVPRPQDTRMIENIIMEEADTYFSGVKTAQQVAEIIQNRVQLYLNEQ